MISENYFLVLGKTLGFKFLHKMLVHISNENKAKGTVSKIDIHYSNI